MVFYEYKSNTVDYEYEKYTRTNDNTIIYNDRGDNLRNILQTYGTLPRNYKKCQRPTSRIDNYATLGPPSKITNVAYSKWTPKSRKVNFENTVEVKSYEPDARRRELIVFETEGEPKKCKKAHTFVLTQKMKKKKFQCSTRNDVLTKS